MYILNLISVIFWLIVAVKAIATFWSLKDQGLFRREVTAFTIVLLCSLNITRGLIELSVDVPHVYKSQLLLEYFYIGLSVFQILLCDIVLKHIKPNQ